MKQVTFDALPCGSGRAIGVATLNSEKTLNALTLDMVRALDRQLAEWECDARIVCVLLNGSGDKAFCAGGDVRALRHALLDNPPADGRPNPVVTAFFAEEYALDFRIHRYPKPLIVWGHGIVMGGGLGLLAGASHRVLTTESRLAMPEITIGLYPDVGGSWFLSRMPGRLGLFLALTGAPLGPADALFVNLADYVLPCDHLGLVLEQLCALDWSGDGPMHDAAVTRLLSSLEMPQLPQSVALSHFDTIRRLMHKGCLTDVARSLEQTFFDDPWLAQARQGFIEGCPTSAALSWEIARRTPRLSLADVFRMELILSVNVCARPDFTEGVRAMLIDKDRQPHWCRNREQADRDWIDAHFRSPWAPDAHPLARLGRQDDASGGR